MWLYNMKVTIICNIVLKEKVPLSLFCSYTDYIKVENTFVFTFYS